MEQKGPEFQFQVEGVGVLRISMLDGEVIGLEGILEKADGNTCLRVGQAVIAAGETFEKGGNYPAAVSAYTAAYQLALQSRDRLNIAAVMINLGLALKRAGELDEALRVYEETRKLLEEPEGAPASEGRRTALLANLLRNTATLQIARRAPEEAERAANWAIDLVRYADDSFSRSVVMQCEEILKETKRMRQKAPPDATLLIDRSRKSK
jgi:tetratricopeptide (TPR) repeat protein